MNILARIISFIFHPLLMATYLIAMLSFLLPSALFPISEGRQSVIVVFVFLMTFALPAMGVSTLRIMGVLKTFTMHERSERIRPFFLITVIYCFVTIILATKTGISTKDNFFKLLLIIDCLVITATVITFFYKISIHSIGIAGVLGILVSLNRMAENNALFIPIISLLIITGVVMSARLQLNSHTAKEVWLGSATGFLIGFGGIIILF